MHIKARAKKRGLPFDLTPEWAAARWTGRCEISGLPFQENKRVHGIFSPSVDQIIPSAGYTKTNCRFVIMGVNSLKGQADDAAMYLVAEAIILNRSLLTNAHTG